MLHSLNAVLAPALAQRLTLLLNHVLASETVALDRLRPHRGATLQLVLTDWPRLLPPPPVLAWTVTPAGMLDWCGPQAPATAELTLRLDAANPAAVLARALAGQVPAVQIEGDAQLAAEVNWLLQNLRWDVAADAERLFGPAVAQALAPIGRLIRAALTAALKAVSALDGQWRA